MMTVKEASRLTGISIRTLQYYDKLGLLPAMRTESGYRLYDDAALERLQQILLFRELEFPLRDIRTILDNPNFDRRKALRQQIELLTLKKQHLEDLIRLARTLQAAGGHTMQFKEFDTSRIDEYTRRAKESWGDTPAYREFEQNAAERMDCGIAQPGSARRGAAAPDHQRRGDRHHLPENEERDQVAGKHHADRTADGARDEHAEHDCAQAHRRSSASGRGTRTSA